MKKLFVLTAAMAMVFASCKKYEVSKPLDLESLPKIKLIGSVYAPLDETKTSGVLDLVPQSKLVVQVSIPYNAYDANNTSGGYYVKNATITSAGNYEVEVPYVSNGVRATISFLDFTADVEVQNDLGEKRTVLRHFTCPDQTVNNLGRGRREGDRINIDATYSLVANSPDNVILEPTHKVKVTGMLWYHAADTGSAPGNAQYKRVPDIKITATIELSAPGETSPRKYTEIQTISVSNGIYLIDVPMVASGTATLVLSGEGFWNFIANDNKTFVYRYYLDPNSKTVYDYRAGTQECDNLTYIKDVKLNDVP
jgi:hypothetical protein